MSDTPPTEPPIEVLKELNDRCDRYERMLKSGATPDVTEFLGDFHTDYRAMLEEELRALADVYRRKLGSTEPAAAAGNVTAPESMDNYRLLEPIGRGGMGVVYRAVHTVMNRPVAVKILTDAASRSESARKRFRREAVAAARLFHPNVVAAYDAGESDGRAYLVTELVDGEDLGTVVKRDGPLSVRDAVDYVRQAALGLAYAHAAGVIHRDVKPSNLLRDRSGRIKVLDVGLALLYRGAKAEATQAVEPAAVSDATVVGTVMGTVDFMAPEQAVDPSAADARRPSITM
jgi:serine/threonine-protein kinase